MSKAFEIVPSADIPLSEQASSVALANHSVVVADATPPSSPRPDITSPRPPVKRAPSFTAPAPGSLYPPATACGVEADVDAPDMVLELADGLALSGHSFGAKKSIAGECVFQTGAARARE